MGQNSWNGYIEMHWTKYGKRTILYGTILLCNIIVSGKLSENVLINWWKLGQNPPEEAKSMCG